MRMAGFAECHWVVRMPGRRTTKPTPLRAHLQASSNLWRFLAKGRLEPACHVAHNFAELCPQGSALHLSILYDTRNMLPPMDC
jgi:hypothetical protein